MDFNNVARGIGDSIRIETNKTMIKQLTIISGKGGTGKTTLAASLAALAGGAVLADCDVDAADLHLLLDPKIKQSNDFEGGYSAEIDQKLCTHCGLCLEHCRFEAISDDFVINSLQCEGCGACFDVCPAEAVVFERECAGQWFESTTRFGPMVHAALGAGQDNSGKLVSQVRSRAMEIAKEENRDLVIIDGPPGVGCPVISAITGVDLLLLCAEPTPSGRHDLLRVLELADHFKIQAAVCMNKVDLAPEKSREILDEAKKRGAHIVGTIPYDTKAVESMMQGKTVIEFDDGPLADSFKNIWTETTKLLVNEHK